MASVHSADAVAGGGCMARVGALPTYYSASAILKVVRQLVATAAFCVGSFHTTCAVAGKSKTDILNRLGSERYLICSLVFRDIFRAWSTYLLLVGISFCCWEELDSEIQTQEVTDWV
jgi:hypothetical protein